MAEGASDFAQRRATAGNVFSKFTIHASLIHFTNIVFPIPLGALQAGALILPLCPQEQLHDSHVQPLDSFQNRVPVEEIARVV